MKIQVLQENLEHALLNASRFISSRAQLPVLGNILLSTKKTKLQISSTNLEISILTSIGAKVDKEGEITVPGKTITEIVSNLPVGTISIEAEKEQLKISTQESSLNITGMNAGDFPSIPKSLESTSSLILPKEELLSALSQVIFAASIDETRPILTGVLFVLEKNELSIVATDGFRLSQSKILIKPTKKYFDKIILPKSALLELTRLAQEEEEVILNFKSSENQAIFGLRDTILSSRILEGEFPDFAKIIPKSSSVKVDLDKNDFLRAVKLASVFARDSANVVKIKINKDSIDVFAESASSGSQKTKVDAKVEGEGLEVAFNYRFLEDFLNTVKNEGIKIELSNPQAPGVLTDPKDPNFLHLIMPVRIQD